MGATGLDTIAAIATPPGRGGVGIVRISGPACREIAIQVLGYCPAPRQADYRLFKDAAGGMIDQGIALFFNSPHSFTGEDVLELHAHGGPVVLNMVLERAVELGARISRPGEFSERAFMNGKMDLAQAEAVADLISADSIEAARAATRSLQGEFSKAIQSLVDSLIDLRAFVEAALDFPEEEIDFLSDKRLQVDLAQIHERLQSVWSSARQGCLLRDGMTVVIAGKPNAGKSSLLNRLAGRETAIVTDIPGTTRDVLREHIHLAGMPLHIIDTAGLRHSDDPVEREGVRRAWDEIRSADRLLLVIDDHSSTLEDSREILDQLPAELPLTVVYNKADLSGRELGVKESPPFAEVALSAKNGAGIDLLEEHLKQCVGYQQTTEGQFLARSRHLEALSLAQRHLITARDCLEHLHAGELLAEELRRAQQALSEITGEFTSEDLLGRIFSSFCIGK